jgi:hypothetical protein
MDANPYTVRPVGDGVDVVEDASGATWKVLREAGGYTVIRTQRVDGRAGLAEIWNDATAAEIARRLGGD